MNIKSFLLFLAIVSVTTAAYYDFKWRRIPNFITFPSLVLGVIFNMIFLGMKGFKISMLGLLIGGGFFLICYLLGGMGAGDVKLAGGVGALLGGEKIITVLILTVFAGGLMAIFKIAMTKWLKSQSKKNLAEKNKKNKNDTIKSSTETIPYGVAIAIGTILTIIGNWK